MISANVIRELIERNHEVISALEARRGRVKMLAVRKASEAIVLTKLAQPPEHVYAKPQARVFVKQLMDETSLAVLHLGILTYEPRFDELSPTEQLAVSDEFTDELDLMTRVVMETVSQGLKGTAE
jgi:hypothetical protein